MIVKTIEIDIEGEALRNVIEILMLANVELTEQQLQRLNRRIEQYKKRKQIENEPLGKTK